MYQFKPLPRLFERAVPYLGTALHLLHCGIAAIGIKRRTRDKTRHWACQKQRGLCDFFRLSDPLHRMQACSPFLLLLISAHRRIDTTRQERICPDTKGAVIGGYALTIPMSAAFEVP